MEDRGLVLCSYSSSFPNMPVTPNCMLLCPEQKNTSPKRRFDKVCSCVGLITEREYSVKLAAQDGSVASHL